MALWLEFTFSRSNTAVAPKNQYYKGRSEVSCPISDKYVVLGKLTDATNTAKIMKVPNEKTHGYNQYRPVVYQDRVPNGNF
jgi:hypothetical protein